MTTWVMDNGILRVYYGSELVAEIDHEQYPKMILEMAKVMQSQAAGEHHVFVSKMRGTTTDAPHIV